MLLIIIIIKTLLINIKILAKNSSIWEWKLKLMHYNNFYYYVWII